MDLERFDARPQDNTSNLSRPRAWIEMNSSALSLYTHVTLSGTDRGSSLSSDRRSIVFGGQGQINVLGRMTKEGARRKNATVFSP